MQPTLSSPSLNRSLLVVVQHSSLKARAALTRLWFRLSKLVVLASLDLAMYSFFQEILWNRQNYELFPIPIILLLCIPLLFPGRFRNRVSDLQTVIPLKCYCIILNGITYPVPSSSLQKLYK